MSNPPLPADENLPEVVPDSSPQVLSNRDAFLAHEHLTEKDPKYVAETSPRPEERDLKYAVAGQEGGAESAGLVKGDDGVWRPAAPVSALSPTETNAGTPDAQADSGAAAAEEGRADQAPGKEEAKVCGMRKRTFWIVLVGAIVVVLAAIGGGVGGGLSARNSGSSSSDAPSGEDADGGDDDDSQDDDSPDENFLNNGTVPSRGIAFQAFSEPDYGGRATDIITSEGFHDLGFNAFSYVWIPNDSGCCVSFCQDERNTTEYWCDERFRDKVSGDTGFPRLGVLCGTSVNTVSDEQWCREEEENDDGA